MLRQVIEFTSGIAQENIVNRGVDSLFNSLSGKDNSAFDLEDMESNFNSLMARAHDVQKEIIIQVEGGHKKRKREVEVWFEDIRKVKGEYLTFVEEEQRKGIMKKILGGDEAAIKLNARICYLDKRSRHFGGFVVDDDRNVVLPRPTTELEGAAFQDNFQRIWNLLENDQVSSIGVHGMGGVGKSTLVEHIHNQLLQRNKCVIWVVVSFQRCSIRMLQDKIAGVLGLKFTNEDDEGARSGQLNHALSLRKNLVLILDDVWERIDLVKVGVPLFINGCKWMMTSRSLNVCREMNCLEKIFVKPLREDEGWNLFLKNLGQDATWALRDPEVERIAKRMVEICDGLPLGIITLAGSVSGVTEIHEWRHELGVLEESVMGHEWMEEKVFRVLKYSFDRLNMNDQRCFLYCSLYPEDYEISRVELRRKFISEKLVDEKKSMRAQLDEAHSIVTRLVKVSLLESVSDWHANECVKMHDLVRAMAHKITNGTTMVIAEMEIPIEGEWTKDLEMVSLMENSIYEIPQGISPNCPKLSTLILQGNPLKRIATSFFTQMCGLRTLDLCRTDIEVLPDSVSKLINLMSLLLARCRKLRYVPCVGKLKELRELDLSETAIDDIPQGTEKLRVQVLRLPWHIQAELVEVGQRLKMFEVGLKSVNDFNRLVANKHDGVAYSTLVGDYNVYFDDWENDGVTRELVVCGYDLKGGEESISADYIQYLEFYLCTGMSKCLLADLSNPTSLQELKVSNCGGIECILTYDQFNTPHGSRSRFQALEVIELHNLEDLMGVIHKLEIECHPPSSSVFSSLRSLTISHCNKMKKLGLPFCVFEKLEYVSIEDCEELEEIIQVGDDSLLVSLPRFKRVVAGQPTKSGELLQCTSDL